MNKKISPIVRIQNFGVPRHQSQYMNASFDAPLISNLGMDDQYQRSVVLGDLTVGSEGALPLSPKNMAGGAIGCAGDLPNDGTATKWMPNEHSDQCLICEKAFSSVFRRKHHCRSCGGLVCSKCSPDKHYVHGYKDQRVRVCMRCAEVREKRQKGLRERGVFTSENNMKGTAAMRASSVSVARSTNDF